MLGYKVALVVLALTAGALAAPVAARAQQPQAAAQRIQFTVVGLSCPFCAYGIEKKLRHELTELDSLGLQFQTGTVTLEVRDGALVTDDQLRAVVRKAGFSVQGDIARSPLGGTRSLGKGGADAR
jgi:mercuric ion binding protein